MPIIVLKRGHPNDFVAFFCLNRASRHPPPAARTPSLADPVVANKIRPCNHPIEHGRPRDGASKLSSAQLVVAVLLSAWAHNRGPVSKPLILSVDVQARSSVDARYLTCIAALSLLCERQGMLWLIYRFQFVQRQHPHLLETTSLRGAWRARLYTVVQTGFR